MSGQQAGSEADMARSPIPGPLILGNAGEMKLVWDFGGRVRLNVLHFTGTSSRPVNQANTDSANTAIRSLFSSSGLAVMTAPSYGFRGVTARDISSPTNPEFIGSPSTNIPGDGTTDALPSQIAMVVSLKTDKRGRNYRGRVYIPGVEELQSDTNGLASAGYQTAVTAFMDGVRTYLAGVNWPLAVVSRAYPADDAAGLPAKIADFANVVAVSTDQVFDTQRRRRI